MVYEALLNSRKEENPEILKEAPHDTPVRRSKQEQQELSTKIWRVGVISWQNIAIIEAGPGGYVAAIRGAQLGGNIYLIEDREVGGTCLNRGCIPTKTYFRNAEIMNTLRKSEEFGITVDNFKLDGKALQERKTKVVNQLVKGIEQLISSYKNIELIPGRAQIKDNKTILVNLKDGETRRYRR